MSFYVQLALEQHRFVLCESTYSWICSNKYLNCFNPHFEVDAEGQLHVLIYAILYRGLEILISSGVSWNHSPVYTKRHISFKKVKFYTQIYIVLGIGAPNTYTIQLWNVYTMLRISKGTGTENTHTYGLGDEERVSLRR